MFKLLVVFSDDKDRATRLGGNITQALFSYTFHFFYFSSICTVISHLSHFNNVIFIL